MLLLLLLLVLLLLLLLLSLLSLLLLLLLFAYWCRYLASMSQHELNMLFGLSEALFSCWFIGEFFLRVVAARSIAKFASSFANWLELICAVVAVSELAVLSGLHERLFYEVWGMPYVPSFSTDHVRPYRIIVPLRFLLMSRRCVC